MAFMNKNTFFIVDMLTDTDDIDDWFHVDEFIAPAIRELNLKGYRTEYCCQGHAFVTIVNDVATFADNAYIAFLNPLPEDITLPENWEFDTVDGHFGERLLMRNEYEFENFEDYIHNFEVIMNAMKSLYEWACALPDLNKSE